MSGHNHTHDPARRSWVESAEGSDFPIQNLPFGVFQRIGADEEPLPFLSPFLQRVAAILRAGPFEVGEVLPGGSAGLVTGHDVGRS